MVMRSIRVISYAPEISQWLANTRQLQVLHIFDRACNLVNEKREVLSIVTTGIGDGPFNLVVADFGSFLDSLKSDSAVTISGGQLVVEDLLFSTAGIECWHPIPDWESLRADRGKIVDRLSALSIPKPHLPESLTSGLAFHVAKGDISSSKIIASQLAGLGMGLTPAGDDYILGALYAGWVIHSEENAQKLGNIIAKTTAPLTTSLSAAWLRAAGKGEAGIRWHEFFYALISSNPCQIQYTIDNILAAGATSGADALAGFIDTLLCHMEIQNQVCPS